MRFPIRHMRLDDMYGAKRAAADGDIGGSFHCRRAARTRAGRQRAGRTTRTARVDVNPRENPYVGCGAVYDSSSRPYVDDHRFARGW